MVAVVDICLEGGDTVETWKGKNLKHIGDIEHRAVHAHSCNKVTKERSTKGAIEGYRDAGRDGGGHGS